MSEAASEKSIFLHAAGLDSPAVRTAYLEEVCGHDPSMRIRIEGLLEAHDRLGGDTPPTAGLEAEQAPSPGQEAGAVIGDRFKLLELIGEGGMGTVWLAEQIEPVRRKVALKLIKPGMDSRSVLARFSAERQALALMDHPNIAKVLDGGATADGRPFFVMELVKGVPITTYCDEHHLTPKERLELFVSVCQAVQHAHQKGIIHRDLKPSNVLVAPYDGRPVVKVIDFGVAKAAGQQLTEKTLFTGIGSVVGTLEYMSPEQAELNNQDIDTRSDIYSLGVLLYELLTGSTPLTSKRLKEEAFLEMLRMIREEEPPKPSTRLSDSTASLPSISAQRHMEPAKLTKLVRGELDWIVMKALEKDRNRRYETANGFAMDVQRYLADEPVLACPPSAGYRFRKFARRNKAKLVMASVIGAALLLAVGGIGWNVRDRAARQVAVEQEVNLALNEAERLQEQAKWPEALSAARRAEGLLAGGGSDELHERVQQLRKDVEMVLRVEEIPLLLSDMKENKWDYEGSDQAYAKAFADYGIDVPGLPPEEAAARIRSRPSIADALVAALDDWAYVRFLKKDDSSALRVVAQAADADAWRRQMREAAKLKDVKTLTELAASPDLLRQPPTSLLRLAKSLKARGLAEAELKMLRQAQLQYPGDFWTNFELARCLHTLETPSRDEAIAFYRAALAVRPQNAVVYTDLGAVLREQKKLDEAEACYKKAIELDAKYAGARVNLGALLCDERLDYDGAIACFKEAIRLKPDDAIAHHNLGVALRKKKDIDGAIACFRQALRLKPDYAPAHHNLAHAFTQKGLVDDAIAEHREAVRLKPDDARGHYYLAHALVEKGLLDDAIAEFREAIRLKPDYAGAHAGLGDALTDQKKFDEAVVSYKTAIRHKPDYADAHYNLGNALANQRKLDEAIAACREAIRHKPDYAEARGGLGEMLKEKGLVDEGIAELREAIRLDPSQYAAHALLGETLCDEKNDYDGAIRALREAVRLKPDSFRSRRSLGNALRQKGLLDEAITEVREAVRLKPSEHRSHYLLGFALDAKGLHEEAATAYREAIRLKPNSADVCNSLGIALEKQNKPDEAIRWFKKAIEIDPKYAWAHYNLGRMAQHYQKKPGEAIAWYRQAIELDPNYADSRKEMATLLATCTDPKLRDPRRAVEHARKAVELRPQDVHAWQVLGWAQYRAGAWRESIEALEKSCKLQAGGTGDCFQWIVMSLAHGKLAIENELPEQERSKHQTEARRWYDEAVKQIDTWGPGGISLMQAARAFRAEAVELLGFNKPFEKLVAAQPNVQEHRVNLGHAYAKHGQQDQAIAQYTKAIELKSDAWEPWSGRAFVHFSRRQWDNAIADFSKAIDLAPQVHTNWWHRGHGYLQLAQWEKAAADFGTVVDRWPNGSDGWYLRAFSFAQMNQPGKALADLRQAIAKGFNNAEQLKNDPRFAALRTREDFRKMVEELERKRK